MPVFLFFEHMLRSNNFRESRRNVVKLPEDDETSFAVFAEYLYLGGECDTGAVLRGFRNEDQEEQDTEMEDDASIADDQYNFMLQFSCYVLADKLQALGFKRHIMDEIWRHGEFCDPADLTVNDVRYVYDNTISQNDPLRRFCVMMKCKRVPIEQALDDSDFIALMEDGGPLVEDVMQMCRKLTLKQKQRTDQFQNQAQKLEGMCQKQKELIQTLRSTNQLLDRAKIYGR